MHARHAWFHKLANHVREPLPWHWKTDMDIFSRTFRLFSRNLSICMFLSFRSRKFVTPLFGILRSLGMLSQKGWILQLVCVALCTDLGVGLVVQQLYISVIVEILLKDSVSSNDYECNTKIAFLVLGTFLTSASFFIVSATSFDRFLAIALYFFISYNKHPLLSPKGCLYRLHLSKTEKEICKI